MKNMKRIAQCLGEQVRWDQDTKTANIDDFPFLIMKEGLVDIG